MCTHVVSPVKHARTKTSHSSLSTYLSIEGILKKRTVSTDAAGFESRRNEKCN